MCMYVVLDSQSCQTLLTLWTVAPQSPLFMEFSRHNGVSSHSLLQGNLPDPWIQPRSPALQADSLPSEPQGKPYRYYRVTEKLRLGL